MKTKCVWIFSLMFFQRNVAWAPKIKTTPTTWAAFLPNSRQICRLHPPLSLPLCRLIAFIDLTAGAVQGATTQWGRRWRWRSRCRHCLCVEEDDDQTPHTTHTHTPRHTLSVVAIPLRLLFFGTLLLVIVVRIIIIICFGGNNISNSLWMMRPSAAWIRLNRFHL